MKMEQQNYKAWQAVEKLNTVLEKNNLLDTELLNYIWDLEDYIKLCESEKETINTIYEIKAEMKDLILEFQQLIDSL